MKLFKETPNIDLVGMVPRFRLVSVALVLASVLALTVIGLNFGIDFAGGYEIQVKFPKSVTEMEVKQALVPLGISDARVQRFGEEAANEYLVMVREEGTIGAEQKAGIRSDFMTLAGGEEGMDNLAIAESGESVRVTFTKDVTEAQVREVIGKYGLGIKSVTMGSRADKPEFMVVLISLADKIEEALRGGLGLSAEDNIVERVEFVGPQVGAELRNQGIMAIVYALGFILLYIAIRFDFFFAPGAIVALIHDVMITMGIFAVFQLEFNLPIIAAILALVGYSLNDTIVVYDRIRENGLRLRGRGLRDLVNTSLNQTLSRTLLTSVTTLLVVLALIVFGGGIIRDFSIALLIGIVVGTYSSVFVASPLYIALRERSEVAGPAKKSKNTAVSSGVI